MSYEQFLLSKTLKAGANGKEVSPLKLNAYLFPFQRDLARWALQKGRSAIFADTGLGKTLMQLAWAEHAASRVLIVAPLAVAQQTVTEGQKWGIPVTYARSMDQSPTQGLTITNYEMVKHFDADEFGGVVLDESSILKSFDGKTRTMLIRAFRDVPMRLACTATPAPNDISELANHAEFLGIMSRVEMLAAFFVHDDKGWRLKKHAREPFYRWLASWGMSLKTPSDLGYSDDGYKLPPLEIIPYYVATDYKQDGVLFVSQLRGIAERGAVRKATLNDRVKKAAALMLASDDQFLAWVGLNEEGRELAKLVPDAVLIEGSDSIEKKSRALLDFAEGKIKRLITKAKIAGLGMNFQRCYQMVFVGIGDSFEVYYQTIRRCYRFGQQHSVKAHIVLSQPESTVYENVLRKEREAVDTQTELLRHVAEYERAEIGDQRSKFVYQTQDVKSDEWTLMQGDSAERLAEIESASIDLSLYSPPFSSLFTYSPTERDLGNSRTDTEFWDHYSFITQQLLRIMKPGRNVCVHVQQLPTTKQTDGFIGMKDFRGQMIAHHVQAGFIYHGEVCVDKDPQAQAIRTHSKGLLFVQKDKDSTWLRPAFADYILVFRVPGDNEVPVIPDISNNEWIEWARPIWYGIKETHTLNVAEGRDNNDERHICALQLETIERCVRLWSNKGETVLSPFAGIGSEGYQSVLLDRKFIGCELKPSYFTTAVKNLTRAESLKATELLFSQIA